MTYLKPATPLPWDDHIPRNVYAVGEWVAETNKDDDAAYIIHASNAFPHLVAALEAMVDRWEPDTEGLDRLMWENACSALAIARGESKE